MIAVTGHRGRVGTALAPHLDDDWVGFDNRGGAGRRQLGGLRPADFDGVAQVVHLAAIPWGIDGVPIADYMSTNVEGTMNVAQCAAVAKVKHLVFASSWAVYGADDGYAPAGYGFPTAFDHWTDYALPAQMVKGEREPVVAYGMSKLIAEHVVATYAIAEKYKVSILRIWPLGNDPQPAVDAILQELADPPDRIRIRDVET